MYITGIRYVLAIASLVFLSSISHAQNYQKVQGYAEKGGLIVQVSPTVTHKVQASYPNCTITVYLTGTTTLASIYSNDAGTIKANPFTADSYAYFSFYIRPGRYDIKFSGVGITTPFQLTDITIGANSSDVIDVEDYGAVCDGLINDAAAIQAAFNAININGGGGVVKFPPGKTCLINTETNLPLDTIQSLKIVLDGYGTTLKTTNAITIIKRMPTAQSGSGTTADNAVRLKLIVQGFRFQGTNLAGQKGLDIGATYGSVYKDLAFDSLDTGMDLQFNLNATIVNCLGSNNNTDTFVVRWGTWPGGSTATAGSSNTIFQSCRVYNRLGASASYKIRGTSGVRILDSIGEGDHPINYIDWDYDGATTAPNFEVRNFHAEGFPSNAVVKAEVSHQAIFENIFYQGTSVLIDATNSINGSLLIVRNVPSVGSSPNPPFKAQGGEIWDFSNIGTSGGINPLDPIYWVGGVVPTYAMSNGVATVASVGYTNSMRSTVLNEIFGKSRITNSANYPDFGAPSQSLLRIENTNTTTGVTLFGITFGDVVKAGFGWTKDGNVRHHSVTGLEEWFCAIDTSCRNMGISNTGLVIGGASSSAAAERLDVRGNAKISGSIVPVGVVFASLGTPANGTMIWCTDCNEADPCASGGNGSWAKRQNARWKCN